MKLICQYCGKEFNCNSHISRRKFCSRACCEKNRCTNLNKPGVCAQCGIEFVKSKFTPANKFCSHKCQYTYRAAKPEYKAKQKEYQRRARAERTEDGKAAAREYNQKWREQNADHLRQYFERTKDERRQKSQDRYYENHEKSKKRGREGRFVQKYGLTVEDVAALIAAQDGRCAICERSAKRLVVDHNHATGKIRKMLCDHCNVVVGNLENHPHLIPRWQQYIASDGEIAFS